MNHLTSNDLIPHQHHGGVPGNTTMNALITLIGNIENGIDTIALAMDQSMAYDVVDHAILTKKLEILGLVLHSLKLMKSYMSECFQYVQLEGYTSYPLATGDRSVIQGSSLSCVMFLIYTLDLPLVFDLQKLTICQAEVSQAPSSTLYIDDNVVTITRKYNEDLQLTLDNSVEVIEDYMKNNRLQLNREKKTLSW